MTTDPVFTPERIAVAGEAARRQAEQGAARREGKSALLDVIGDGAADMVMTAARPAAAGAGNTACGIAEAIGTVAENAGTVDVAAKGAGAAAEGAVGVLGDVLGALDL